MPVPEARLQDRRAAIVAALRHLMLTQGYAETTLTDLAKAAGLSVSHLLYYFPSKEAVLEELCSEVIERHLEATTSNIHETPEERIHVLVDNNFVQRAVAASERGMILELVALALHRPKIRRKIQEYARRTMEYLTDLYQKVPRQPELEADDAAEIAAAVWMGLFTNAQYDETLDEPRARRLFRRSLLGLAGITNTYSQMLLAAPAHEDNSGTRTRRHQRSRGANATAG